MLVLFLVKIINKGKQAGAEQETLTKIQISIYDIENVIFELSMNLFQHYALREQQERAKITVGNSGSRGN